MTEEEFSGNSAIKNNSPSQNDERKMNSEGEIDKKKNEIPEGMSKNQWKKELKRRKWEETKDEYRKKKREKRKEARQRKKTGREGAQEEKNVHQQKLLRIRPEDQTPTQVKIIIDCEFDNLMNTKEITSLSNQITRAYSAKRHCQYGMDLEITSFSGNLKQRFDSAISQYNSWKGITFTNEPLSSRLPEDMHERLKFVYLTADTDNVIEELQPDHVYIIGGIVDKNRHKNICRDKAQELGLTMGRLPIDKYIKLNSRQVLATSHVFEICCKWFENDKDWAAAFNQVLPPRKISNLLSVEEEGIDTDREEAEI